MDRWTPEEIKELRQGLGITQAAFGELTGVTSIYVNYLEKGVRKASKTLCILMECIKTRQKQKRKRKGVD